VGDLGKPVVVELVGNGSDSVNGNNGGGFMHIISELAACCYRR